MEIADCRSQLDRMQRELRQLDRTRELLNSIAERLHADAESLAALLALLEREVSRAG